MKNKNFFYLQYNQVNWKNQEKTKINFKINNYIIKNTLLKKKSKDISLFDIGFGIGIFFKMFSSLAAKHYKNIIIEGCEPSKRNYGYFLQKIKKAIKQSVSLKTYNKTFLNTDTNTKFDFVTAIYVFPHFILNDIEKTAKKIYSMLREKGRFILVLAEEKYLERKLKTEKDLFIENNDVFYGGKKYKEILHYSDIPEIGKIIDYNREEAFYINLFRKNKFVLKRKENINDSGFICTLFIFEKN